MILKLGKFQGSEKPEMEATSLNLAFFYLNYIFHQLQEYESINSKWPDITLLAEMGKRINRRGPNSSFAGSLITLCFSSIHIIKWR